VVYSVEVGLLRKGHVSAYAVDSVSYVRSGSGKED
jgi:hypothetical protein